MNEAAHPQGTDALHRHLLTALVTLIPDGPTLLLEHGSGALARRFPHALHTDRLLSESADPRPDFLCLPERLPVATDHYAAIAGIEVLGHSPSPAAILSEVERCLQVGGRAVFLESWTGPLGRMIHALSRRGRRLRGGLDPWFEACPPERREQGNAAAAKTCLSDRADELPRHVPALSVRLVEPFAGLAELASLRRSCRPETVNRLMKLENRAPLWLRRMTGSRTLVVMEKVSLPFSEDMPR